MTADTTVRRLRRHAGLDQAEESSPPTVAAATAETSLIGLEAAVSDFVDALEALNHELNGPEPSTAVSEKAEAVAVETAYAVAEVARMLREAGAEREAWAVDTAWLAILAGDIDDVRQHVTEEKATRGE
jgi:hypothetical protein